MLIELVADVCAACPGGPYSLPPFLMGAAGAPTTGPPPGESSDPPPDTPDDDPESDDPGPEDQEPDWWDSLFGSDPAVQGAAESVAQDLATGAALDYAAKGLPGASGMLGALGTIVGGSQTLAEGVTIVVKNDGKGFGGDSNAGKENWDIIAQERAARQPKSDD